MDKHDRRVRTYPGLAEPERTSPSLILPGRPVDRDRQATVGVASERQLPKLIRVCAGFYKTVDGLWEIYRGERGYALTWAGMWIFREARHAGVCSDPIPTLREAREQLAVSLEARRV